MANNGDELIDTGLLFDGPGSKHVVAIGNYHKTLPHNRFGEVDPDAYAAFKLVALTGGDYDIIARGSTGVPIAVPFQDGFLPPAAPLVGDKFNNPQAARSGGDLAGGPKQFMMGPAPKVRSLSTAAEMTELQWMAIHRDTKFSQFTTALLTPAINDLKQHFKAAVENDEPGGLRLGTDLPVGPDGKLAMSEKTIFRCGLLGEDQGPLVSQFFLHDIAYGAQFIQQRVRAYAPNRDFLITHGSWLRAQNCGFDEWGHGYAGDNDFGSDPTLEEHVGGVPMPPRRISTMRDLARFVNKDALHQAYFNAALLCLAWGVPLDQGNPYLTLSRQAPFGSFGGPDLLTRVSEVASRALEVVWRQKWEVHRRLRPEVYGGLMQMQAIGLEESPGMFVKRAYGLPSAAFTSKASQELLSGHNHNYYLPLAFTAGSPPHPAYGAGHATVAGACVTVLKAWLDEKTPLQAFLAGKKPGSPYANAPGSDSPVVISTTNAAGELQPYAGVDAATMTVEGELNKLASNVAMGRSMGGVHWRSDNTRSMRLGEQLAAEIMRRESLLYAERRGPAKTAPFWSFTSFNNNDVLVFDGRVLVNGADMDPIMEHL
jgi:PAP2 superfamily.